jgi:hypothetical protein
MSRTKTITALAALFAVILAAPAIAQQEKAPPQTGPAKAAAPAKKPAATAPAVLEEMSRQAYEKEKWVSYYGANIKLLNQRPFEPEYMLNVIAACALLNRKTTAYHYFLRMQQQGLSYDLNQNPDTMNIRDTEVYTYLNDLMIQAGQAGGIVEPVFTLDEEQAGPVVVTWDESRNRFLAGTQSNGAIVAISDDGNSEVLIQADVGNGLWAIKGLHADAQNNRLWVSSAAIPGFSAFQEADKGRGALFEFDLKTLELIKRYDVPADGSLHEPGPIAVADSGDVYMLDQGVSQVYRKAGDADRLEVFIGIPEMTTLQGIAVTPDNARLYVSDLWKGVLVVDPEQQSSVMLAVPETMNMGRIQSITYDQGHLVITQSGFMPERVMRLKLDASGGEVLSVSSIASAMADFADPGDATVRGEHVYYFASPRNDNGDRANEPMTLLRSPLVHENDTPPADMKKALDKYQPE